jgi:hypothetical protein
MIFSGRSGSHTAHCTLPVLTLYTPASHNIKFLRWQCERLDDRLIAAWPRDSRFARRHFEKLRRASDLDPGPLGEVDRAEARCLRKRRASSVGRRMPADREPPLSWRWGKD